ncbi:MAG: hypothetical protein ACJAV2_004674 [Myxococcota bacterium]|jgi:hypothetical protein
MAFPSFEDPSPTYARPYSASLVPSPHQNKMSGLFDGLLARLTALTVGDTLTAHDSLLGRGAGDPRHWIFPGGPLHV